jgi:hypothetical protein
MLFRKSASNTGRKPFSRKPTARKSPKERRKNILPNVLKMEIPEKSWGAIQIVAK